jgi:hypothetical protein
VVTSILPPSGVAATAVGRESRNAFLLGVKLGGTGSGTSMTSALLPSATQSALDPDGEVAMARSMGLGLFPVGRAIPNVELFWCTRSTSAIAPATPQLALGTRLVRQGSDARVTYAVAPSGVMTILPSIRCATGILVNDVGPVGEMSRRTRKP